MADESWRKQEPLASGLEGLPLGAFDVPRASDELRAAIRRRTSSIVRARPHRLRVIAVCGVLAAYAAGLGTVLAMGALPEQHAPADTAAVAQTPQPQVPATAAGPAAAQDPQALLARVWEANRPEQIRLLTLAGDVYLAERGDVARALDCYSQVMELTPRSEPVKLLPQDTWLFASLKLARIEEVSHENARS